MFEVDSIQSEYINKLSPYRKKLLQELRPLLEKIEPNKIAPESGIDIKQTKKDWVLSVTVVPLNRHIPSLDIRASKNQCVLYFMEHEDIECHRNPESDADYLIKEIVARVQKYLKGITIIEYYDRKNKLLRKEFYFGIDTEEIKEERIGVSIYGFTLFRKVYSKKKITYSFMKQRG